MEINLFGEKVQSSEESETKSVKPTGWIYSPFALQDGVGERSSKRAWIEYIKLRLDGIEAEEVVHKIISKARDMFLISRGARIEDLSLKNYPYQKSKRDLKNWPEDKLQNFYTNLITTYHHSRLKPNFSLDHEIEKILLSL